MSLSSRQQGNSTTIKPKTALALVLAASAIASVSPATAQKCTRLAPMSPATMAAAGYCGIFTGEAIIWPDGTRSSLASNHPGVIIGNRPSVIVGKGVMAGNGHDNSVEMENPGARTRCPTRDGVPYCNQSRFASWAPRPDDSQSSLAPPEDGEPDGGGPIQ